GLRSNRPPSASHRIRSGTARRLSHRSHPTRSIQQTARGRRGLRVRALDRHRRSARTHSRNTNSTQIFRGTFPNPLVDTYRADIDRRTRPDSSTRIRQGRTGAEPRGSIAEERVGAQWSVDVWDQASGLELRDMSACDPGFDMGYDDLT